MCRLIGWVTREPTTLRALLGDDAVERLLQLSSVHCHGWGVAWREGEELLVRRSQMQASEDPDFLEVLDSISTTSALVHLRLGTPGFDRLLTDTHPFHDGDWALAHNGAVGPSDRVDALLPTDVTLTPQGTTDSERWFLALRHAYEATEDANPSDDDPVRRVAAAAASVVERATAAGLTASSWNSLLLGPDALYVLNLHDDAWQPGDIAVWPAHRVDPDHCWPPYFDLRVRERDGERVVTSSGVIDDTDETADTRDTEAWSTLPNGSVLRFAFDASESRCTTVPGCDALSA